MLTILLFSIPLSSYITLSVVVMVLWAFFVMTKLQIDTSVGSAKRATRPEPTPFSFFKPGDNPIPLIPPSTLSDQELAISVPIEKGRGARREPAPDTLAPAPEQGVPDIDVPLGADSTNQTQQVPAPAAQTTVLADAPDIPTINPDFAEADDQADFALYQPRQVSIVVCPPIMVSGIDARPEDTIEPTPEQIKILRDLQTESDEKALSRKRKTEKLMKLAAGLDFEAYVKLFRAYYEQAMAHQKEAPERAFYVLFGELIAGETTDVQEQLLMLLDKEATDKEPEELVQAEVYTEEQIEEVEPGFT